MTDLMDTRPDSVDDEGLDRIMSKHAEPTPAVVEAMADRLPADRIQVAESGIKSHNDIMKLSGAGYDAFLIGEHLVCAADPEIALQRLLTPDVGSGNEKLRIEN